MLLVGGLWETNLLPVLINLPCERGELIAHFIEALGKPYPVVGHNLMELHRRLPRMHERPGNNALKFGVSARDKLYSTQPFRRS